MIRGQDSLGERYSPSNGATRGGDALQALARGGIVLCLAVFLGACVSTVEPPSATPQTLHIITSNTSSAYLPIAKGIARNYLGQARLHTLPTAAAQRSQLRDQLQATPDNLVIAVGLPAAQMARQLSAKQLIFCQLSEHEAYQFVAAHMHGVSSIPSLEKQLATWKKIEPTLNKVVLITGPGVSGLVRRADRAAKRQGIHLRYRQVNSDKELLYVYKQMATDIQGLWLLPDNRVLSRSALRELLAYSVKHGKQVLVFNHQLLQWGAMISGEAKQSEIIAKVLGVVGRLQNGSNVGEPVLTDLYQADIKINPVMVKRQGLVVPAGSKGLIYAP